MQDQNPLAEFAGSHGLAYASTTELPAKGGLLGKSDLKQGGTATGDLADGEPGTLAWLTYTYRSDDTTHTVKRTAAVLRISESLGFAPYLSAAGIGVALDAKRYDLEGGGSVIAAKGMNDGWLAELFSPAFTAWLQRNPDDFQWELTDGVLCVSREGYMTKESDLAALCSDAAHIAATIRDECLEEVESGEAKRTAADEKEPTGRDKVVAAVLSRTTFDHPPADVEASRAQFREQVVKIPGTYITAFFKTLLWMLVVNIVGGGLYGLLLNLPNPGMAVLVYQGILFVVIGFFVLRGQINGTAKQLASEGFWQQYAKARGLRFEEPSEFAATHAKADLPGNPVRVMTGTFDGMPGSLMVTGDGLKRGDSIALVTGESGPTATAEFDVSAPGPSAAALDKYAADLVLDLKTRP